MPSRKLKEYLDQKEIRYRAIAHRRAFTARKTALAAGIPEDEFAKTVMVKINEQLAMVVLPASERVNIARLREITRAKSVKLAKEHEFRDLFPDCEIGAEPPFGNLYGVPVFISDKLPDDEEIAFKTGLHSETAKMPYQVYECLVSPEAIKFAS